MIDILKIKENFMLESEKFTFKLISEDILEEYIEIMRSDFYNEFLDFKFNKDITKKELVSLMKNKAKQYKNNDKAIREFRFIVLNSEKHIIAGFTLFFKDNINELEKISVGDMEIAYFVTPENQGQGIASRMLYRIFARLAYLGYGNRCVVVNVQSINNKSLNLLKKLNFKTIKKYRGKFGTNIQLTRLVDLSGRMVC